MKTNLRPLLLAACAAAPFVAVAADPIPPPVFPTATADAETLDYLASRTRVGAGMERGIVLEQLGAPAAMPHPDVWVYPHFRAANVYGQERYDTLVVSFREDRVARVTLTTAAALKVAAQRLGTARAGAQAQ